MSGYTQGKTTEVSGIRNANENINRKFSLKKFFIHFFLDRGEEREKERERNINVWLPLMCPLLGTWPATQACAITRNQTLATLRFRGGTQSIEPHQPGLNHEFSNTCTRLLLILYLDITIYIPLGRGFWFYFNISEKEMCLNLEKKNK